MQRFLRGVDQAVINLFFRSDWTPSTLRQYPDGNLHSTKIESWHRYSVCLPSNGFSWPYSNLALLLYFKIEALVVGFCKTWPAKSWPRNSRQLLCETFCESVSKPKIWICLVVIQEAYGSGPMLRTTYLIILQGKQGSQIELFPIHSKVQMGYKPIIFTLLCTQMFSLSGHFILQESKKKWQNLNFRYVWILPPKLKDNFSKIFHYSVCKFCPF